ncbi:lipid II flippase family protein [Paenibacillus sp. NRS-1781]|uniref:lipid II flippase family protein n=1 Tax=Paenibacillus sp. NRS-1781 TaxID=3233905 RepID=UPI003D2770B6
MLVLRPPAWRFASATNWIGFNRCGNAAVGFTRLGWMIISRLGGTLLAQLLLVPLAIWLGWIMG